MKSFIHYLSELWISPQNGAKYGQVIFLVGGAAAGKSTAIKKFIDDRMYKTLNPDDAKQLIAKAAKRGMPAFKELGKDIDPHSAEGAQELHQFILKTKLSSKRSKLVTAPGVGRSVLPNILYDRTFSFAGEFKKISQNLIKAGYKSENIHIVFVFTDVDVAIQRNKERERTLPDDVIVQSAQGAKARFTELFFGRAKGAVVNGDWYIIFKGGSMQVKKAGKRLNRAGDIALRVADVLGIR
jgi:dephospho-CoA kinase